jgi:hypothetical protein
VGPGGSSAEVASGLGCPCKQECVTTIKVLLQGNCLACLHRDGVGQHHIAEWGTAHDMRLAEQTSPRANPPLLLMPGR